jgi:hypothetical protein
VISLSLTNCWIHTKAGFHETTMDHSLTLNYNQIVFTDYNYFVWMEVDYGYIASMAKNLAVTITNNLFTGTSAAA